MVAELEFGFAELDVIGAALQVNVRRFPFVIGHHGTTREERIAVVAEAHHSLAARNLVRPHAFAPELVEAVRLFAEGRFTTALVGTSGGARQVALAVADGDAGLVAVERDESIAFHRHAPEDVVAELVGLLPPVPPGPSTAVTVPTSPATPDEDFSDFRFTSRVQPAAPSARTVAATVLRRPRTGAGYFTVVSHGEDLGSVTYLDTDTGRYAIIPDNGNSPAGTVYTPADHAELVKRITQLARGSPG
ncbi:ESX secretion-associated protein EspG [Saccharothrix obliqua]|uniref:ESX secretion-associated protein EspG n=1 Tax=Saccharothrix obliqua TaxID=2861747 RepID=UPI001C5E0DA1|nr:ESX secretion-associated protein EspG [Saccharothrix obliqua]MBW4716387.1 ESX secretion-associated protein EspG [Saccharothrix obliqua]